MEIAVSLTANITKEGFRCMEVWLIKKLLNILHLILEFLQTLEESTNKTYHCALKSQYFLEILRKILGYGDVL